MKSRENNQQRVIWNEKEEKIILRTLIRLMELIEIVDGEPRSPESYNLRGNIAILGHFIEIKNIRSDDLKKQLIFSSVIELRKTNKRDLLSFRNILENGVDKFFKIGRKKRTFIFPINITQESLKYKRWFKVEDIKLKIQSWTKLEKKLDIAKWKDDVTINYSQDKEFWLDPFIPLEIEIESYDIQWAFRKAEEAYVLLRTAINFPRIGMRGQMFSFEVGRPDSLFPIPPAPSFGVYDENGNYQGLYFNEFPEENYESVELKEEEIRNIKIFLKYFGNEAGRNTTKNLITRAFKRYTVALDSTDWGKAFLNLWQVCELLAFNPRGKEVFYTHKDVRKRVRTLLKQNDIFISDMLLVAYEKRNHLVHRGEFIDKENRDTVQNLKILVENMLFYLIDLEKDCPTWESLEIYYINAIATSKVIKERKRVLEKIEKRRKVSSP